MSILYLIPVYFLNNYKYTVLKSNYRVGTYPYYNYVSTLILNSNELHKVKNQQARVTKRVHLKPDFV